MGFARAGGCSMIYFTDLLTDATHLQTLRTKRLPS
jgi:hypothetical protein